MTLRPFQRRFVRAVESGRYDQCALSVPRGNGKSWLAAHLVARALTPGDALWRAGYESCLFAPSLEQCRIVYKMVRRALPEAAYSWQDSGNRIGIRHRATDTRLRAIGSKGQTAMGIGADTVLAILDEPGSLEVRGGELLADTIETSLGKPDSIMRVVYIGTIWPATGGWWPAMIEDGTQGRTYVQSLQGDADKWDRWPEIRRCNPLTAISPEFRRKLLAERDAGRRDERRKARFLSTRLNLPSEDPSSVLLTVDDWKRTLARPVPAADGRPIVAVDLGGGRAWSAAVALWRNGRTECIAVAPGLPSLDAQEARDLVPRGEYARLSGPLTVDEGRRVPRVAALWERVKAWQPEVVVCDRFRLPELADETDGTVPLLPRVSRWSESTEDIRALRTMAADGPLTVAPESQALLQASLKVATVKTDDAGNIRLIKRSTNNTARDDVAAALVLAAGALSRAPAISAGPSIVVC